MYVPYFSENKGFLTQFENTLSDVTPPHVEDLPQPSDLPRNITPLSENTDIYLTSGSSDITYVIMVLVDIFLGEDISSTTRTVKEVCANEVIINKTYRTCLDAKHLNRFNKKWFGW